MSFHIVFYIHIGNAFKKKNMLPIAYSFLKYSPILSCGLHFIQNLIFGNTDTNIKETCLLIAYCAIELETIFRSLLFWQNDLSQ